MSGKAALSQFHTKLTSRNKPRLAYHVIFFNFLKD